MRTGTGVTTFLGGLAKGIAQGHMMKYDRERQERKDELTKQLLKIQMEQAKTSSETAKAASAEKKSQMEFRNLLLNSPKFQKQFGIVPLATEAAASPYVAPTSTAPAAGTGTGAGTGAGGASLPETLALGQMNPFLMQMLDYATGGKMGFAKGLETAQRKSHYDVLEGQGQDRIDISRQRMRLADEDRDRAYQHQLEVEGRKYAADSPPDKTEEDIMIKPADIPFWVNPDTMERASPGMSPRQLKARGFKRINAGQLEKVQKIEAVNKIMANVERMMLELIPETEAIGRIGGIARGISAEMQMTDKGQKLAVLRDYVQTNRVQVAKALGEVGNLSESEQEAVTKGFGAIDDAGPKAWMQFRLLKKTFEDAKDTAFGKPKKKKTGKGRPGSAQEDKELEDILFNKGN